MLIDNETSVYLQHAYILLYYSELMLLFLVLIVFYHYHDRNTKYYISLQQLQKMCKIIIL